MYIKSPAQGQLCDKPMKETIGIFMTVHIATNSHWKT